MPDVEITNPIVQIDLSAAETTTVPAGERWKVSLMSEPSGGDAQINGGGVSRSNNTDTTAHLRTDLFGGDTVKADSGPVRIRGYQVEA